MASRLAALERRLSELEAEISRKDAVIARLSVGGNKALNPSLCTRDETIGWLGELETRLSAIPSSASSPPAYAQALVFLKSSAGEVQQESRKLVLCRKDASALALLTAAVWRACETLGALALAAATCKLTTHLRCLVLRKAKAVCTTVRVMMENLENDSVVVVKCGLVEEACNAVTMLPVSSKGATKRLLLELIAVITDTSREFGELAEGRGHGGSEEEGKHDDEDDQDDDQDEEELSTEDCVRMSAAVDALNKAKLIVTSVSDALPQDDEPLELISDSVGAAQIAVTDFAFELYPPHDFKALIVRATEMSNAFRGLAGTSTATTKDRFAQFEGSIGLLVA
jgi:hypothetical protein